jgi:hypothetical protein
MRTRTIVAVAIAAPVAIAFGAGALFVSDPKTNVHLRNDYQVSLDLSCGTGDAYAEPSKVVNIRVSVFDPEPCFVYIGKSTKYFGCFYLDPTTDGFARLSQGVKRDSEKDCESMVSR